MASTEPADNSAAARQRGNEFYRKGQFAQAEKAYAEAAKLAPDDPSPWSNMSAINFEQGDYSAALVNLENALALSSSEPDEGPKKQKLLTRMTKCHLHALGLEDAEAAARRLDADDSSKSLRLAVEGTKKLWASLSDETAFRGQIFDRLPRYKCHLQDMPEYYAMGHDIAEPLLDQESAAAAGPDGEMSFLICGSGDARHLFINIMQLFSVDFLARKKNLDAETFRMAHLTIVDLNPTALARTLVMFRLLIIYNCTVLDNEPNHEDEMTIFTYVYSSAFIPPFVEEELHEAIMDVIDILEADEEKDLLGTNMFDIFYVPKDTRQKVLRKLIQWSEPLSDDDIYATQSIRMTNTARAVALAAKRDESRLLAENSPHGDTPFPKQCTQDFRQLGVVFAERSFMERHEPDIIPLLDAYRQHGSAKATRALGKHIDAHWKVNKTMLDMDWEERRDRNFFDERTPPDLTWDPLTLIPSMVPRGAGKEGESFFWHMSEIFGTVGRSIILLHEKLQIEVIAGEMADVMDRIRHGGLEHRRCSPSDATAQEEEEKDAKGKIWVPSTFPRVFDGITMSNIPDYIGGPLTTMMYAAPLLRPGRSSLLRYNCLLNPPMFHSHEQFLAEYMLMHDDGLIADHFGVVRDKESWLEFEEQTMLNQPSKTSMSSNTSLTPFLSSAYMVWDRAATAGRPIPKKRLMPRPILERFLHAHLLKICLPYTRPSWSNAPVYAPLNLTAFFRLVAHLFEVGYPAHWLSGVLEAASAGSITTTARPPRRMVLRPEDVNRSYPARRISLAPWKAEFTTLLSLWRRLLGFGVAAPGLPGAEDVVECAIDFPVFQAPTGRVPHYAVIFYDQRFDASKAMKLPEMIQDDEQGDDSETARELRQKGVHLVTAVRYVTEMRTATFWIRRDVVDEVVQGGEWQVGICSTDLWEVVAGSTSPVAKVLRTLGPWTR